MSDFTQEFYKVVVEGEGVAIKDLDDDGKCVMHIPGRAGLAVFDHYSLLKTPAARMHFVQGVLAGIKVGGMFGDPVPGVPEVTRFYIRVAGDDIAQGQAELCIHFRGRADCVRLPLSASQQANWACLFSKNTAWAMLQSGFPKTSLSALQHASWAALFTSQAAQDLIKAEGQANG